MARSRTPKFDASEVITNEIIRIIERGVLPWRKPWTAGGSSRPLRVGGEPYQGVNNFLLTMRTVMAGHSSPFWMTLPQADALDAKVRKGEKSSVVVYFGQSRKDAGGEDDRSDGDDRSEEAHIFRFQKSYRVFNACQIEGLPDSFFPILSQRANTRRPSPSRICRRFSMRSTSPRYSRAARPIICRPSIKFSCLLSRGSRTQAFLRSLRAHELAHATKAPDRLNRDFGFSKFGNTSYAREEIVAELTSCFLGQELGFTAHTLEMNAAYLYNWLRVLRSDKTAIFKHAADAQRACDYLIARSEEGRAGAAPRPLDYALLQSTKMLQNSTMTNAAWHANGSYRYVSGKASPVM